MTGEVNIFFCILAELFKVFVCNRRSAISELHLTMRQTSAVKAMSTRGGKVATFPLAKVTKKLLSKSHRQRERGPKVCTCGTESCLLSRHRIMQVDLLLPWFLFALVCCVTLVTWLLFSLNQTVFFALRHSSICFCSYFFVDLDVLNSDIAFLMIIFKILGGLYGMRENSVIEVRANS